MTDFLKRLFTPRRVLVARDDREALDMDWEAIARDFPRI